MKKIIAIFIMCALVFTTTYSAFEKELFNPPNGCYTPKLVKSIEGRVEYLQLESLQKVNGNGLIAINTYDFPSYNPNCYYRISYELTTCYYSEGIFSICNNEDTFCYYPADTSIYLYGDEIGEFYWDPQWGTPSTINIGITSGYGCEPPYIGYKIQIYEECKCKTTLYPKVDIEQFLVAGGPTVIQDGKVISNFTMTPGSQQVLLQVENRGFFTQKDARVRFEGLPNGVTVDITPDTQILKAHNIGTYSATFTVDPNVPSGTYQITMIAYSPTGVFDTITFEFIVP